MTKRDNPVPLIIGVLVTLVAFVVLLFLGATVLASAIVLAIALWKFNPFVCLGAHGIVMLSGGLGYLATSGLSTFPWWAWIVGAPFLVWAGVIALMATFGVLMWGISKLLRTSGDNS